MNTNGATAPSASPSGYSAAERQEIANTIIAQINAGDFWARARWGVRVMIATERAYGEGLGRDGASVVVRPGLMLCCNRGIKIIVTLDPSDTYSIELGRMGRGAKRFDFRVEGEATEVYADDLARVIDREFSNAYGTL